jgi:hypothetical protein
MFTMGNVDFDVLHGYPSYVILGVICGGAAVPTPKPKPAGNPAPCLIKTLRI